MYIINKMVGQMEIISDISNLRFENLFKYKLFDFNFIVKSGSFEKLLIFNKKDLLSYIVINSININAVDREGKTALHLCCCKNVFYFVIKELLERNIDISLKDSNNNSALHYACFSNNINVVKLLIDYGADINSVGYNLYRPIHIACYNNYYEIVKILISKNCDLNAFDIYQKTPYDIALKNCNCTISKILIEYLEKIKNDEFCDPDCKEDSKLQNYLNKKFYLQNMNILSESHGNLYFQILNRIQIYYPNVKIDEVLDKLENLDNLIFVLHETKIFDNEIVDYMSKKVLESLSKNS